MRVKTQVEIVLGLKIQAARGAQRLGHQHTAIVDVEGEVGLH